MANAPSPLGVVGINVAQVLPAAARPLWHRACLTLARPASQVGGGHPVGALSRCPPPAPVWGWALPLLYWHSPQQARLLVQHLPGEDRRVLRTAALCLACLRRQLGIPLPAFIVGRIVSLCLAV